tara:strand:- start:1559 stop:1954 length:396 start_codon:yes stop_codon:yes gene_type:complete
MRRQRIMRSQRKGGLSAITKVKVFSPVIVNIAQGQGFHVLEASTAACVRGECVSGVPGSKSMAGNPTVHIGTWDNHIAPYGSFQQAEEARRKYGDVVVGLTYSRGVVGAMPGESPRAGTLEGVSSKTQRDE